MDIIGTCTPSGYSHSWTPVISWPPATFRNQIAARHKHLRQAMFFLPPAQDALLVLAIDSVWVQPRKAWPDHTKRKMTTYPCCVTYPSEQFPGTLEISHIMPTLIQYTFKLASGDTSKGQTARCGEIGSLIGVKWIWIFPNLNLFESYYRIRIRIWRHHPRFISITCRH